MKNKLSKRDVLPWLDPPPGGLASLRARLERPRPRPLLWGLAATSATAAAATILAVVLWTAGPPIIVVTDPSPTTRPSRAQPQPQSRAQAQAEPTLDLERHPALAVASTQAVSVPPHARSQVAVSRAAPDTPEVIFYWVSAPTE